MAVDPTDLRRGIVDRKRVLELINTDLGPDLDEDDEYDSQPSAPEAEAAPSETAVPGEPSPPSEPEPPSPQPPSYDWEAEAKQNRAMIAQMLQQQQEYQSWQIENERRKQEEARRAQEPQPDPDEWVQRHHLSHYDQQFGRVAQDMRYVVQETRELRAAQMHNEFSNTLNRFQSNPEQYPDFDKYVPKAVLDNAIANVQREIRQGRTFNPGDLNWSALIEKEYRINAFPDLLQERKTRSSNEAKRAEVQQKLNDVGGTPRGGAHQAAAAKGADKPLVGDRDLRSRILGSIKAFGAFSD